MIGGLGICTGPSSSPEDVYPRPAIACGGILGVPGKGSGVWDLIFCRAWSRLEFETFRATRDFSYSNGNGDPIGCRRERHNCILHLCVAHWVEHEKRASIPAGRGSLNPPICMPLFGASIGGAVNIDDYQGHNI